MNLTRRSLVSKQARTTAAALLAVAVVTSIVLPQIAASAANPTASAGNAAVTEGDSGTTPADVTFTLSQASPNKPTVSYTTADGTAAAPGDYVTQTGTVVFNPGETTQSVAFSVRGDTVDESNETFKVNVTAVDNGYDVGTFGTVTITDNDAAPSVRVDTKSYDEGSSGGFTNMPFIARLSAPAGTATTYYAFTHDPEHDTDPQQAGNQFLSPKADAGVDYTAVVGTAVTFAVGETTATVNVPVKGDLTDEFDEYFELQLKATNSAIASTVAYGNGKIIDDDALARLDVSDPTPVSEGDTTCGGLGDPCTISDTHITFTVTLSPASEKRVVVDYATSDRSATTSNDYVSASGSGDPSDTPPGSGLVFNPGETSKTVDVYIKGDTQAEPVERFALTLSNPVNAALGDSQAFGTILNDDPGGNFATVTVTNAPTTPEASGSPKAAGTATFTINVARTSNLDTATYQVSYQTADGPESSSSTCGKAVAGKDYVAKTGTASIAFPQSSTTVAVTLIDDNQNEADECFQLQLNDATNASISDAVGEAKITDDDAAPSLAITPKSVTEGTGTDATTASMTVTMTPASGQDVSVTCATTDNSGTATEPEDYVKTTRTITFSPGDTSKPCDIPVVADAIDENNETLTVALSNVQGNALIGTGTATLTINDDDLPPTVAIGNTTHTEGTGTDTVATLGVSLSAPSGKAITVRVATANGSATQPGDYTATTADLTFNPGERDKDFQVPVKGDAVDEPDETFTGTLTNPASSPVTLGTSTGTATIQDDDDQPSLAINDVTVTEGNSGTTNASFTVTRTGATEKTMTVHYATGTSGTATSTTDYTATTGDLSFAPGEPTKTIAVPVKGDTVDEPDETFNVVLSAPTNASISDASGTGTITDDDPTPGSTTTTSTTSTTLPGTPRVKITTGPGAGGGPHIRVLNGDGTAAGASFFDGAETAGKRVARGDLDGDGIDEIITAGGANSSGYVSVYNATGVLLVSTLPYGNFTGGIFVAAGDINNDGFDEIITAAGPGGGPHVRTFSYSKPANSPASLLGSNGFYAFDQTFGGGVTVGAGDLNNDGKDEILTGMASQGSLLRSFSYTGTGGATKGIEIAPYGGFTGGVFPAAGDITGDANAEIVTATGPGGGGDPHLRTFNPNGTPIGGGVYAYNVGFRGGFSVAVGDINGDGKGEIITGAGPGGGPHVKVFNASLVKQSEFFAYAANFLGGVWVSSGTA